MRYIIIILLACLSGYGLFMLGHLQPGNYIKMYVGVYLWELTVIQFLVLVFLLVLSLHLLFALFRALWKAPKTAGRWKARRDNKKADAALGSGYLSLIKGDWKRAEKSLLSNTSASRVPYVNYLAAAQAAQEQGKLQQRDEYLNAAYKSAPDERLAIGLTKARLHQAAGQYDQAAATLQDITDIGKKNSQFTAMLMQTHQQLGNWEKAVALLPVARKQEALPIESLDAIYNESYTETLKNAQDKESAWKALPKDQRKRIPNIVLYAGWLIGNGESAAAEKLIRSVLKSDWSDELVRLYGQLPSDKPGKLRRVVEGWLMARPESAELNLAAGQFALQEKNTDLAKEYLQKAVQLGQLPKAYSLLGEAYESTNESGKALQLYRVGMASLSKHNEADMIKSVTEPAKGELLLAGSKPSDA
jgi:HemY protein